MANIIEIILSAKDKASAEIKKVGSALAGVGKSSSGVQQATKSAHDLMLMWASVSAGVGASVLAMKEFYEFSEESAQILRLRDAGNQLAASMGSDMDKIVEAVSAASRGTVSNMDIIASANKAMMLGVSADAGKLANLMEIAALRGRAMGVSTTQAFDDIVRGIGRMSPLILDNLGIIVDADSTYGAYAESLGKTAAELSATEKRQALLNKVLEEGNNQLAKVGGLADDAASAFERNAASMKNFTDNVKLAYAETVNLGDALNRLLFAQQQSGYEFDDIKDKTLWATNSQEEYNNQMMEYGRSLGYTTEQLYQMGVLLTENDYKTARFTERTRYLATETDRLRVSMDNLSMTSAPEFKMSIDDMMGSQANFIQLQQNYLTGTGDELYQLLSDKFPRGGEALTAALQEVDAQFGTSLVWQQQHKDAVENLVDEYGRTKDIDAFRDAVSKVGDNLPPATAKAKALADELARLYNLMLAVKGVGPIRVDIIGNVVGGGGVNQHITPPPGSPTGNRAVVQVAGGGSDNDPLTPWARGGSFIVPPGYPNDTYRPPIRLTSGERVDITPRGKTGGVNVTLVYSPAVALGDRYEAEAILAPMIERALRKLA